MRIVVTQKRIANHIEAAILCDYCYLPITKPADARLLWEGAGDQPGSADALVIHAACHRPFLRRKGNAPHHWIALNRLPDFMKGP